MSSFGDHGNLPAARKASRRGRFIDWIALVTILACLFAIGSTLPLGTGIEQLKTWVADLGLLGPIAFGSIYILGTLMFIPGGALSLAAGAVFGLLAGVITLSIASTTAAALAFLIARYLARTRIEALATRHPRLGAVDRAIEVGGWRIVALLRLVPAFPFSAGNYIFGLTAIGFWPYVLASWIFMLPGTILYTYIGYLGGQGLSASGVETTGEIILLAVGLLAVLIATIYLTRLAKTSLRNQNLLASSPDEPNVDDSNRTRRTMTLAVAALAMATIALSCQLYQKQLASIFGPPIIQSTEAYKPAPGSDSFDHSAFDQLLRKFVDADGWVDYQKLGEQVAKLDAYLETVRDAPFQALSRNEKLALLINAYNACTLRIILDHYPVKSIKDIPDAWGSERWEIGGMKLSLDQLEHEQIRPKFKEPRIHFALVCAAIGCPILRNQAYIGEQIEAQLEQQTRRTHESDRWFEYDRAKGTLRLTKLYDWYRDDFKQASGSLLNYVAQFSEPLATDIQRGQPPRIEFMGYDWNLNDLSKRNR